MGRFGLRVQEMDRAQDQPEPQLLRQLAPSDRHLAHRAPVKTLLGRLALHAEDHAAVLVHGVKPHQAPPGGPRDGKAPETLAWGEHPIAPAGLAPHAHPSRNRTRSGHERQRRRKDLVWKQQTQERC